jgi:hypothetical protein
MDKLEKLFDLVERLSDVRSNSLTFGKLATSSSSWIAKSARTSSSGSASVLSIAYVLILGEPCLKHVLREILQDASRINHAGVDLLRVHLDGQEA